MTTCFLCSLEKIQGKEAEAAALGRVRVLEALRSCGFQTRLSFLTAVRRKSCLNVSCRHEAGDRSGHGLFFTHLQQVPLRSASFLCEQSRLS